MPEQIIGGFIEVTLETDRVDELTAFYRSALGLRELSRDDDRVWLAVGSSGRLGIWCPGEKEYGDRGGRHVHFALSATPGQLDAIAERLADHGVATEGPVEHDGGDRSLYFRDLMGNVVEIWDLLTHGDGAREGIRAVSDESASTPS